MSPPLGMGVMQSIASGPTWTPASLASLLAWYRSDVLVQSGGFVSQWTDQSGNGRHATAAGAAQPGYVSSGGPGGRAYLTWTGAQFMTATMTANQPCEMVAVCRPTSASPGTNAYLLDTGSNNNIAFQASGGLAVSLYSGSAVVTGPNMTANADTVIDALFGGGTSSVSVNNGTPTAGNPGSGASGVTGTFSVGAYGGGGSSWVGRYYELIVVGAAIGSGDRASLVAYLLATWGVA